MNKYFEVLKMPFVTNGHKNRFYQESIALIKAQQAKIDKLMWEYCPEEMTKEQVEEWKKCQVVYKGDFDIRTLNEFFSH